MEHVSERFLRYAKINTTSDENSESCPSSKEQWELARLLVKEMLEMGIRDARVDENGYVYGSIPANCEDQPVIGLIAHMDTVDAVPGRNFNPQVIDYKGGDICLNAEKDIWLKVSDFPELKEKIGKHLIVTDGTTVLGADDKAGIAEIMALCEKLINDDTIKHGKICIGFTPDEEIGRGADLFDVKGFNADFAYTADGGALHEVEYENFNAASARVTVHGRNIHPGSAKGRMKHASRIAMQFDGMLPEFEKPEYTEGYEGFYHLCEMKGDEENASLVYILRDHDGDKLEEKKAMMLRIRDFLNARYGENTVEVAIRDSYRNMREVIEKHMYIIDRAEAAMRKIGLEPVRVPVRGGTDGARLSFMGLPCPNLGTGGANYHGINEYIAIEDMEKAVEMLQRIIEAE
ncbi:MAG: peptidase T [Clostridia bacterium]|nr:peptidase T [Clostridia bacterium]